ncbi:MAG: hypothetical protein AAB337_01905 [Patescibacteria group bacterium]
MPDKKINPAEQPLVDAPDGIMSRAETVESAQPLSPEVSRRHEDISVQVTTPQTIDPRHQIPMTSTASDPLTAEIEQVLSQDLDELYNELAPDKKERFKVEGEKVASLIRQMMKKGKLHTRKVLVLIRRWLGLIPGVNRFFLEQESKIKTDRILMIEEEEKQK